MQVKNQIGERLRLPQISFRCPPDMAKRLRVYAAENERNIGDVLVAAVEQYLDWPVGETDIHSEADYATTRRLP